MLYIRAVLEVILVFAGFVDPDLSALCIFDVGNNTGLHGIR
jgi:hypothetical protein